MRIRLGYGRECLEVDVAEGGLVAVQRQPVAPPLADPAAAVRAALEAPLDYPALRLALTPDDHVAVVLGEELPRLAELLVPVLEHIGLAGVAPSAITLLCPPSMSEQPRLEGLPERYQAVRCERHDPTDRKQLAYLATTRQGRRLYLNRTAIDADQVVILSARGYDPVHGYSGAEASLYPALSDEAALHEANAHLSSLAPGAVPWPVRQEAVEAAWLLGAPFLVQVIPGAGDEVTHVLGGPAESSALGRRLLDARWKETVAGEAGTVVATLAGDPARHTFADLARAAACAARVVRPDGRIILLSAASPARGAGADVLRRAEGPAQALETLRRQQPADVAAAFQWAAAAQRARLYLLSALPNETAEELFAEPLQHAGQVQRMLADEVPFLFIADAHRALAVVG